MDFKTLAAFRFPKGQADWRMEWMGKNFMRNDLEGNSTGQEGISLRPPKTQRWIKEERG